MPTRTAVTAATICSAAVSAHFVAGKATRDALFLANADVTSLPGIVAATAALSIALVALSSFAIRRIRPEDLFPAAFAFSAALLMVNWLLVDRFPVAIAWAVYLQVAGLGPLLGSGFWLLASERFDPRTGSAALRSDCGRWDAGRACGSARGGAGRCAVRHLCDVADPGGGEPGVRPVDPAIRPAGGSGATAA